MEITNTNVCNGCNYYKHIVDDIYGKSVYKCRHESLTEHIKENHYDGAYITSAKSKNEVKKPGWCPVDNTDCKTCNNLYCKEKDTKGNIKDYYCFEGSVVEHIDIDFHKHKTIIDKDINENIGTIDRPQWCPLNKE